MAKRFTDTELWDKEWFMKLSPKLKCLVKMVRDKCDLSGVWSPNWIIANTYIGESVTEDELLSIDGGKQFIKISTGKIFCVDFIEFQYGKLGENSAFHKRILQLLDTHSIPYQQGIYTPKDKVKDKEGVKEEDKVKVKSEKKIEIIYPFNSETFMNLWEVWRRFKKEQFNFTYKPIGEQGALKELSELSKGNEETAIKIIRQSIQKGWKGFFNLQTNGKSKLTDDELADAWQRDSNKEPLIYRKGG